MKNTKRIIAAVLCMVMLVSVMPITAYAAYENTHTNTGNQIEDLIAVANTQLGYTEGNSTSQQGGTSGGSGNYTKYGAWYGINPGAWCAMYVSWCANQAGISSSIIPKHASCDIGMQWFQNNGKWQWSRACGGSYTPKRGDIIYFRTNPSITYDSTHVGIVTSATSSTVYTIEGNASNKCQTKSYALTSANILGYGTPAYTSGTTSYVPGTYKVTASSLNMRNLPTTSGTTVLQALPNGAQITVTAVNGNWGYTTYNGVSGWISLAYCQLVASATYYTLTLDPNGGTQTSGQSTYSITPQTPYRAVMGDTLPQATRKGYTFNGWYNEKYNYTLDLDDVFSVNENATFKAQWTAQLGYYTITTNTDPLNIRNEAGSASTVIGQVPKGTKVNITTIYGDWGFTSYGGKTGWVSLAYCTYYGPATTETETYTLTFNTNGGTLPSGVSTTYEFEPNEKFIDVIGLFPVPVKDGYTFTGWRRADWSSDFWTEGWGTQPYTFGYDITLNAEYENHTHSHSSTVTKAATCTSTGTRTYVCDGCGDSYTESIAKTEHFYTSAVTTQASCTAAGVRTYTCSNCGGSYTESIAKISHLYDFVGTEVKCIYCDNGYGGYFTKNNAKYYCVNGMVQKGIFTVDGSYYYAGADGVIVSNGTVNVSAAEKNGYLTDCGDSFYAFDADGKMLVTGFVTYNGVTRYYNGTVLAAGFTRIGSDYYYFDESNGNMVVNDNRTVGTNSYGVAAGTYYFLADGKMYRDVLDDFSIIEEDGDYYLYTEGKMAEAGLYFDGADYYYVMSDGTLAKDMDVYTYYSDILPKAYYRFGSDCKMMKDGWLDLGDGRVYYFINAAHASGFTKIGSDYYFFNINNGEMRTNTQMWVGSNNYGISVGPHSFGSDGKMISAASVAQVNYFVADGVDDTAANFNETNNDAMALVTVAPVLPVQTGEGDDEDE